MPSAPDPSGTTHISSTTSSGSSGLNADEAPHQAIPVSPHGSADGVANPCLESHRSFRKIDEAFTTTDDSSSYVENNSGFGQEGFERALFFPGYVNKAIDAEYRKFLDLQMLQEKPVAPLILAFLWFISNILRYFSAAASDLKVDSGFGASTLASSVLSSVLSVLYLLSYILPLIDHFPPLERLRIRNGMLKLGIISFNLAHCLQLVFISKGPWCEKQEQLYCARANSLSTPQIMGLLCMFYYSFLLCKNLSYEVVMGVGVMNSISLICCSVLVGVGRVGTQLSLGVAFVCVVILGITHHMCSQYQTSFEYYMAYRSSVLSEADRATEMARHEREHLRMVLANVAHDLKTPLQAFDAGIHTIRSLAEENMSHSSSCSAGLAAMRDVLSAVDASCAFMSMQINRALDVSKIQSHVKLLPKYEGVNIDFIVRWAVNTMSCIQSRIAIHVAYTQCPPNFSNIVTDKVWFQENLLCLLSNAVKYSNDDSSVELRLRVDEPEEAAKRTRSSSIHEDSVIVANGRGADDTKEGASHLLTVEVVDSGIGVPEDRRDRLFKPFSQTQRCAGGTGLGLYSLALRVHRLGGSYGMRPRSSGGSVFYFTIPVKKDVSLSPASSDTSTTTQMLQLHHLASGDIAARTSPAIVDTRDIDIGIELPDAAESNPRLTPSSEPESPSILLLHTAPRVTASTICSCPLVLVVDDAPTALKMVQRALVQAGAEVHTATNGFVALKMMKSQLYTLVIMDIQMPVMDGFESVRQLRAWERGPGGDGRHQYIIGASATPPDDDISKYAIDVGMDAFSAKPFVFQDLVQRVKALHAAASTI